MNKRVRYAFGALGLAPALALPLNHAATAKPHVSGRAGKRVSLAAALNPAATCFHQADHSGRDDAHGMNMFADWDGTDCVFAVRGSEGGEHVGDVMRVRLRSHPNGTVIYSKIDSFSSFNGANDSLNWTVSRINHSGTQVCAAILNSHGSVVAGPNCVST